MATGYKEEFLNNFFSVLKYKPDKWDVWKTVPVNKAQDCIKFQFEQKWSHNRMLFTHQVNDKTCKIQNNKASPKFFHC